LKLRYIFIFFIPILIFSQNKKEKWDPFLDTLQEKTIRFFLDYTDKNTGLSPDRSASWSPCSVAAVGYALTVYPIAIERKIITRSEAAARVINTLKYFSALPQNDKKELTSGYMGLFYHFLNMKDGTRVWNCELSTIDTGLLMAGVLFCMEYFNKNNPIEKEIRSLAENLYKKVNWQWAFDKNKNGLALGWKPDDGFDPQIWKGYNEAMILYILALGSPSYPIPEESWDTWTKTYIWAKYYGQEFISFGPLFGHQYSHVWIDFRSIKDDYMREKGIDYFENSRRATYSNMLYAKDNPKKFNNYSEEIWGISACDGPQDTTMTIDGVKREFIGYGGRGVSFDWVCDDGTLTPTAAGGSIPFAPEICIKALKSIRAKYKDRIYRKYGFTDAFNTTFNTSKYPDGWFDNDYLGIDQGPIAIMIENYRNNFVWNIMKKNKYIRRGLIRAGFEGGWLTN
jgi:hypothetical protein